MRIIPFILLAAFLFYLLYPLFTGLPVSHFPYLAFAAGKEPQWNIYAGAGVIVCLALILLMSHGQRKKIRRLKQERDESMQLLRKMNRIMSAFDDQGRQIGSDVGKLLTGTPEKRYADLEHYFTETDFNVALLTKQAGNSARLGPFVALQRRFSELRGKVDALQELHPAGIVHMLEKEQASIEAKISELEDTLDEAQYYPYSTHTRGTLDKIESAYGHLSERMDTVTKEYVRVSEILQKLATATEDEQNGVAVAHHHAA